MDKSLITLKFNECINTKSTNTNEINIQSTKIKRFGFFYMLNETVIEVGKEANCDVLNLFINNNGMNYLKFFGIGYNKDSSFLSWNDFFISDYANNFMLKNLDASILGFFFFFFILLLFFNNTLKYMFYLLYVCVNIYICVFH